MAEVCPSCGGQVTENMKFCSECGADLTQVLQTVPSPPPEPVGKETKIEQELIPPPPPEPEVMEGKEIVPPVMAPEEGRVTEPKSATKVKSKKPLYAVLAVVIAVVVIFAALYFGFKGSEDNPFAGITDTDGDGYNDDVDAFINDKSEWKDTDGDGVGDNGDAFPNNPSETTDSDGDGHGDNSDEFPNDPDEWEDSDSDGVGDNGDAFPNNPNEQYDSDGDGVGDNADAFPTDSTQWADRDGDGYGDNPNGNNPDAFPDDSTEWKDSDSDGVGDNADICDNGNGGIKIHIDSYLGDGSSDESGPPDPYFIIKMNTDSDDDWEYSDTSGVFTNTDSISDPFELVVDVSEDQSSFKFEIDVWDDDFWTSDEQIDYRGVDEYYWTIYTRSVDDLPETWTENGAEDLRDNEVDCTLKFTAEIVKLI